jgi:LPS-assembly protein
MNYIFFYRLKGLILLSVLLSATFFSDLQAREDVELGTSDKVRIISDKGLRKSKDDVFEAIGNVVIIQKSETIYGEKAKLSFATGDTSVEGNVRYIGPDMTLYGSRLEYNMYNKIVTVKNAKIVADNYIILGKELVRVSDKVLTGVDAEYSTCRDCPESWSIFGKKVHITIGDYIRIWHAYIKIKGVVVMYVPYMILPVKKDRETGFLFPKFGASFGDVDGVRYQQPWFWNISPSQDMTITPSVWGKRGVGGEYQYRNIFKDRMWMEVNGLGVFDKIYTPNKEDRTSSGTTYSRYFGNYEQHYSYGDNFNHHLSYSMVRDLDVLPDFANVTGPYSEGSEITNTAQFFFRNIWFNTDFVVSHNRNVFVPDARAFDNSYVQVLPSMSLDLIPLTLWHSDFNFLNRISLGTRLEYTNFRQNGVYEETFIRNAHRINFGPYIDWILGDYGPVKVKTRTELDMQEYRFPYEKTDKKATKRGVKYETEMSFELERVFRLAYKREIPFSRIDVEGVEKLKIEKAKDKQDDEKINLDNIIGTLPLLKEHFSSDKYEIIKSSYKHSQIFKLKHYYLTNQLVSGNNPFLEQIKSSAGQFDIVDSIREKEHDVDTIKSTTALPLSNTVEFQWRNQLIRKTPNVFDPFNDGLYVKDNFGYSSIAYLNISQGYDFNLYNETAVNRLTRMALEMGVSLNSTSVNFTEFYYWSTNEHFTTLSASQKFTNFSMTASVNYNSFSDPIVKTARLGSSITLSSIMKVNLALTYDLAKHTEDSGNIDLQYSPKNNCWKFDVNYEYIAEIENVRRVDHRYSFNFLVNFNDNVFVSLTENSSNE